MPHLKEGLRLRSRRADALVHPGTSVVVRPFPSAISQ